MQLNIYDILAPPKIDTSKFNKTQTTQYSCKFCGYNPRNWIEPSKKSVKYFLLVDKDWKVQQTFCENCVNGSVGADYHKRIYLGYVKAYSEIKDIQLSLIEWNKYTRKTLKLLWLKGKNRSFGLTWYKPYFVDTMTTRRNNG